MQNSAEIKAALQNQLKQIDKMITDGSRVHRAEDVLKLVQAQSEIIAVLRTL